MQNELLKHTPATETISIYKVIRMLTGIKALREGLRSEYALSLVMESQPQINLIGEHEDRITRDQIILVAQGISDAGEQRWKGLNPNYVDRITPILEARKKLER